MPRDPEALAFERQVRRDAVINRMQSVFRQKRRSRAARAQWARLFLIQQRRGR